MRRFLGTARWLPAHSITAVVLVSLSALLEGIALLALAPVLQPQLPIGPAAFSVRFATLLNVPLEEIFGFSLLLFGALALCSAGTRVAADTVLLWIRTRVEEIARRKMTEALMRVRWEVFPELKLGEIGKSVYQEGWYIGVGTQVVLQAVGLMGALAIYLAVAANLAATLTLVAALISLGVALPVRALRKGVRRHADAFMRLNAEMGNRVQEVFGSLKFFRASGMVEGAERSAESIYRHFSRSYFKAYVYGPLSRFLLDAAAVLFISALLYVGLAISHIGLASLLVFLAIVLRAAPRMLTLQDLLFQASTYEGWHKEWEDRLAFATHNREIDSGRAVAEFRASLDFVDVGFRYPGRDSSVLTDINFRLGVRDFVGIVGVSGSGKSTLLDIVTGVLHPTSGKVTVDGFDLRDVSMQGWRSRIGVVLQDTALFHGSILDNVALGIESRDEQRVIECLHRAHARSVLDKLPRGVHEEVGERGGQLSGGERQRVALARALYRAPALLILDEPTSALDTLSEQEIVRALAELKGTCAILLVSHRLTAVRDADRILVLDQGSIVEQGPWDELVVRKDGRLRHLALSQGLAPSAIESVAVQ